MTISKIPCPKCGAEMNHHANKIDYEASDGELDPVFGGTVKQAYTCPHCGHIELRTED